MENFVCGNCNVREDRKDGGWQKRVRQKEKGGDG